jgi:hypothetical protein
MRIRPAVLVGAASVAVAGALGALGWFVVGLVTTLGDNDRYGKVAVPGEGRVELKEGDVLVYYEERAGLHDESTLTPPADLSVAVRSLSTRVRLRPSGVGGRSAYQYGDLDGVSVLRFRVPQDGPYGVVARGGEGRNFPDRAVTFGPDLDLGSLGTGSAAIFLGGLLAALVVAGVGSLIPRPPSPPLATAAPAAPDQPVPPPPAVTGAADPAEELRRLDELRRSGTLSQAEYDARRAAVLERL